MRQIVVWMFVLALALTIPVWAQEESASDNMKRASAALLELSGEWESWEPIPNFNPVPVFRHKDTKDAAPVSLGRAKGLHRTTEQYGHVDVALVYIFDKEPYDLAQVTMGSWEGYLLRGWDGTLFFMTEFTFTKKVGVAGEVESCTFEYTRVDGTKGTRTFTNSKAKLKI